MEQMIITIKNGSVEIDIEGARGARCVELTQALEKLIGVFEERLLKKDFYEKEEMKTRIRLKANSQIELH